MEKISKEAYQEALNLIKRYLEQEKSEFNRVYIESLPYSGLNVSNFIDEMNLSVKAYNRFKDCCELFFRNQYKGFFWNADIPAHRINEIPESFFIKKRGLGQVTLAEIKNELKKYGLELKS